MSEHDPTFELRDVRVLRHRFTMSVPLYAAIETFFVHTQKQFTISDAYATRELVLDEAEYSRYRYYDFIEYYRTQFEAHRRDALLLGSENQTTPALRFQSQKIGNTVMTRVALLPRRREEFNTMVEEMSTQALDADPSIAPYQDIRPQGGHHYLTAEVRGGRLIPLPERAQLEKQFSENVLSLAHGALYNVRPDTFDHRVEIRKVKQRQRIEGALGSLIEVDFNNDVA